MNHNPVLEALVSIRQQLLQPRYDKGELSGWLMLSPPLAAQLQTLATAGIAESVLPLNGTYVLLDALDVSAVPAAKVPLTLYTKNLAGAVYYETLHECIKHNPYTWPATQFYIHELGYTSGQPVMPPAVDMYQHVLQLIAILSAISDSVKDAIGEPKELVFFEKRKLHLPIVYSHYHLRSVPFLPKLHIQLCDAHDKEERRNIFKAELVSLLYALPPHERFGTLLGGLDGVYDNYLKSHLLYLEKFSYHDLKLKADKDKLEYTKKIYATVNDIQSRLIAVPAAYLLVLAQFDYANAASAKNALIALGALLFSVLLDVLLRNQFGVLKYIETEILHFRTELTNADTSIDLSQVIDSFADLQHTANKQRLYLRIFRVVVWLVPLTAMVLMAAYKQ